MNKILLVEDDETIGPLLQNYLQLNNFAVHLETNGINGLKAFKNDTFDLCLLDVMMPKKDGFSLANDISKINPNQKFIFLTAKNLREDVLKGYTLGAFDYIVKPFDAEILVFKIKNLIDKPKIKQKNIKIGKYLFYYAEKRLIINNRSIKLSQKEADLLSFFNENIGKVINREEALKEIWKNDSYYNINTMDVYISRLRKYLSEDATIKIENIHGTGFKFSDKL